MAIMQVPMYSPTQPLTAVDRRYSLSISNNAVDSGWLSQLSCSVADHDGDDLAFAAEAGLVGVGCFGKECVAMDVGHEVDGAAAKATAHQACSGNVVLTGLRY